MVEESQSAEELGIKTAHSGAIFVSSKVIGAVITLALLVFLARYLKPADYGLYTLAVAFSTLIGMAGNFGIGTALRKKLPESKDGKESALRIINNAYYVSGLMAAALAAAGLALSWPIAMFVYHNASMVYPLAVASLVMLLTVLFNITVAVLVGLDMIKESALSNLAASILQAFASVALVVLGFGIVGAMAGLAIGVGIAFVMALAYVALRGYLKPSRPSKSTIKSLTRFSMPVVVANIVASGTASFAIAFLGVFAGAAVVGSFGVAYKLGRFVELLLTSSSFVLLPAFSRALSTESLSKRIGAIYDNTVYYSMLLLLPLLAWLISASKPLIKLLFSSAYASAPLYFAVIAAGTAAGLMGTFAATLIIGNGDTRKFMRYQLAVVGVETVLLVALTPSMKAIGVLVALFIIAPVMLDALYIMALREQFNLKIRARRLAGVAASALIIGILLALVAMALHQRYLSIAVTAVLAILLYPPLVAVLGGIAKNNTEFLITASRRFGYANAMVKAMARYTNLFIRETHSAAAKG